jgi:peptidyl-prolyl cis-trans isomerase C
MRPFEILSRLGRSVMMASSLMCLVGLAVVHGVAHGQAARSPGQALPADAAATVNGTVVSKTEVDRAVARAGAQGQPDTPELRKAIRDELIAREVLAQEAVRQKLDRGAEAKLQLAAARQNVMIDLLFADHASKNPIGEAEVRAEYERQVRAIEERGGNQQYRLRQITLKEEAQARAVIARIRKGEAMEAVARELSIAPSKEQGGRGDWLSPLQMIPAVSSVVVNLQAGMLAAAPIPTQGGWNVIRIEEVRPFKPPTFDESREQVRDLLTREQRSAFVRKLRSEAKVVEQ